MKKPPRHLTAAEQLRAHLARSREKGISVDRAWAFAFAGPAAGGVNWPTDTAARRAWKEALTETRDEWRAAYEGVSTATSARFAAMADRGDAPDEPADRSDGRVVTPA